MDTDRKWVVVRIDGKIAAISTDYRMLASISSRLAGRSGLYGEITAVTVGMDEVWRLRQEAKWDDLMLSGTDFQKKVWRKLWELTHSGQPTTDEGYSSTDKESPEDRKECDKKRESQEVRLISYSDFAELCENRAGVRAVAHAVGLNPIPVVIPCHLVIPKESIDRMHEIRKKAEATIFKGDDLCFTSILNESSINFGEYALGKELKRRLINMEFAPKL